MNKQVSIVKCEDYEYAAVKEAVGRSIDLLGGMNAFIKPGMRVLVKPNLLKKRSPDDNVTTNPAVLRAILELVKEAGATPFVAESPGGPYTKQALKAVYEATGTAKAAADAGCEINYDTDAREVFFEAGEQVKNLTIITPALTCDAVISVAKLKTHEMLTYTGAVKNLFGLVPGITKAEYHFRIPEQADFANMIVDICQFISPVLSVIDGVWGMEGEGPSSGVSVKLNRIIASGCPHSADMAAVNMVGLDPATVFTLEQAGKRGLVGSIDDIEILGESLESGRPASFAAPSHTKEHLATGVVPGFMEGFVNRYLHTRPVIPKSKCVGCCVCMNNCPAKAMTLKDKVVYIDYGKCINCYCCHELCPHDIIRIRRPWPLRVATKLFG